MNIFIGNLSFEAREPDILSALSAFGQVESLSLVMDKNGRKSRGFAFARMPDENEAKAAIAGLNGKEILGRPVNVMVAVSEVKKPDAAFTRKAKFMQGRRSVSYRKRLVKEGKNLPGIKRRKIKPNPMRWKKKRKNNYGKRPG